MTRGRLTYTALAVVTAGAVWGTVWIFLSVASVLEAADKLLQIGLRAWP